MPRKCTLCNHPQRAEIERAITEGVSFRVVSERFRISIASISRHKAHIETAIQKAIEAREISMGGSVLDRLRELNQRARTILEEAQREGARRDALAAIRELRGLLELEAELMGDLGRGTTVNVALVQSPEWQRLRDVLITTLEAFPEAKQAVVEAIRKELGGG